MIYLATMRTGFIEHTGKIKELDRSFDLAFWQAQPPSFGLPLPGTSSFMPPE